MMLAAGMQHQDLEIGIRFLGHIGEVMTVVPGEGVAQNHKIEVPGFQCLLNRLAAFRLLDLVACALKHRSLGGQNEAV